MTISAFEGFDASDLLARNYGLYRDLAVALDQRVAILKDAGGDDDAACREALDAAKAHHRALQTILELEVSLVKRSRSDGGGQPLDLDAARAEILARLAVWAGER